MKRKASRVAMRVAKHGLVAVAISSVPSVALAIDARRQDLKVRKPYPISDDVAAAALLSVVLSVVVGGVIAIDRMIIRH